MFKYKLFCDNERICDLFNINKPQIYEVWKYMLKIAKELTMNKFSTPHIR